MGNIPVYCDFCGQVTPSVIRFGGGPFTFKNSRAQCSRCGRHGRILDGTYHFIEESVDLLRSLELTKRDIQTLRGVIQSVLEKRELPDKQVVNVLQETLDRELPTASKIGGYLRENANLRADLTILVAILAIITTWYLAFYNPQNNRDEIIREVLNRLGENNRSTSKGTAKGVNKPCICGSGKKFKKCCAAKSR